MNKRKRHFHKEQVPVSRKSRNISGDIILFVSWKQRRSKTRNFAVILIFLPITSCEMSSFTEQAGRSFTDGFSDQKNFRDFRETGPRAGSVLFLHAPFHHCVPVFSFICSKSLPHPTPPPWHLSLSFPRKNFHFDYNWNKPYGTSLTFIIDNKLSLLQCCCGKS